MFEENERTARWDRKTTYIDQPVSGPLQKGQERWALVPANVGRGVWSLIFTSTHPILQQSTHNVATSQAQADADLTRALEMSLEQQYSMEVDSFREIENTENVRTGSKPVALRARELHHVFAAALLQALYHVPQVRNVVRPYKPDASNYWLSDSTCDVINNWLSN